MKALVNNLIESLREVTDLDVAHQCCSNPAIDTAAPWLGSWLVVLLNEERRRRALADRGEAAEVDYTAVDLAELPLSELQAGESAAIGILKLAYTVRIETVAQFAWRILELFVAETHLRLAMAVQLGAKP